MEIRLINDAIGWRSALAKIGRYECYHTWDFHRIDTNGSNGSESFFALQVKSADSVLFLPVVARKIPDSNLRDLRSVYGYPGPVYVGAPEDFTPLLEAAFSKLRQMGFVSFFSRCSAFSTARMVEPPACYFRTSKLVTIDLCLPADAQWRQYRENLRRDINHAIESGLQCQQASQHDGPAFLELYHRTMNRVAAQSHYYLDQNYLSTMLASRDFDCRLYVCKDDGRIISAALFLFCNGIVQYHLSGSDANYSKFGASKLLIDYVRRTAAQEGFEILCLGGGLGGRADHLYNFKRGFTKKEEDFYLIKKVLDPAAYNRLLAAQQRNAAETSAFFPAYRQPAPVQETVHRTA